MSKATSSDGSGPIFIFLILLLILLLQPQLVAKVVVVLAVAILATAAICMFDYFQTYTVIVPPRTRLLVPETPEYEDVRRKFLRGNKRKEVLSIEKVENQTLQQRFLVKQQQYKQIYGQVRVVKGWHGTKEINVDSILRDNFDLAKAGQNRGCRFGAGVSFSSRPSYASDYCDKSSTACMILSDVLVSNVVQVPENKDRLHQLLEPPLMPGSNLRYDTTARDAFSMNVFVKFEKDTFLPTHVVHFKRRPRDAPAPSTSFTPSNPPQFGPTMFHVLCVLLESLGLALIMLIALIERLLDMYLQYHSNHSIPSQAHKPPKPHFSKGMQIPSYEAKQSNSASV